MVQQMLFIGKAPKGKFHTHDSFETSKYHNLPIYKLSKDLWVIALSEIFGSVRKIYNLQILNDDPVCTPDINARPNVS